MVAGMRELTPDDLGILLSVFAVLLIFFGIDFRVSRRVAQLYKRRAFTFAVISVIGEGTTAIALVFTWVALFLPPEAQSIDTMLVFVPGSISMVCAVILTGQVVTGRLGNLARASRIGFESGAGAEAGAAAAAETGAAAAETATETATTTATESVNQKQA